MRPRPSSPAGGFTLAEAAVTIALVAVTLTVLLQSLEGSKMMAGHTRDQKIARELALGTLSQIEAGLWQDDLDYTRSGNYSEEGHPRFFFELAIGDETFSDTEDPDPDAPHDNWAYREEQRLEQEQDSEDEEATEPYEKVRVKVVFTQYRDLTNELTLERWMPWEQVYGEDEEEEGDTPGLGAPPGPAPGATTGGAGG